jgi:hypothetical protein
MAIFPSLLKIRSIRSSPAWPGRNLPGAHGEPKANKDESTGTGASRPAGFCIALWTVASKRRSFSTSWPVSLRVVGAGPFPPLRTSYWHLAAMPDRPALAGMVEPNCDLGTRRGEPPGDFRRDHRHAALGF